MFIIFQIYIAGLILVAAYTLAIALAHGLLGKYEEGNPYIIYFLTSSVICGGSILLAYLGNWFN